MNKAIQDYIDSIDWDVISKIYKRKGWKFADKNSKVYFPSGENLKELTSHLLTINQNDTQPCARWSCGRITVYRVDDVIRIYIGSTQKRYYGFWAHKAEVEYYAKGD